MRLLNTTTKQLETFYGEDIPGYAILSHMWGREEDEVLFKHFAGSDDDKSEGRVRKGYAKIKGACKQAVKDGFGYIWIDTCCIDKASSAELSEAINSMFEWYRNSEVCYVYLEDVESSGDEQAKSNANAMFPIVPFERSRWFTRGWTLQELIAPQSVVFYSKGWVEIGTKASLRDTISTVTRIRVVILKAYDPEVASVAEKMSWAAFRKTTRVEDIAYCLMGLLGVNMPLLYGEGNRAFRRLQEEFMKVSDDDSLFAWRSHADYRLEGSRGMLANSPWEFRDGRDIARSKDGAYSPYSMTNQGLQIQLPLLPIDPKHDLNGINTKIDSENTFKAVLKCTVIGKEELTRQIVIYLKKIREGQYERILQLWLGEMKAPPNKTELTTLLVPQGGALTTRHPRLITVNIEVEILPTASGFTYDGRSLMNGYKYQLDLSYTSKSQEVIYFQRLEKSFGVAIGRTIQVKTDGIPWLDFIDAIDEKESYAQSYRKGASRAHLRRQYLDRLCKKIPGDDWWVTMSLRKINSNRYSSRMRVVIDIQKDRAKGWYIPPETLASNTLESSNILTDHNPHDVHPDFKKEGDGWFAIFNPTVKRLLDIDLVYTFPHSKSQVSCIQFSYDGKYFATSSDKLRVYDTSTKTGVKRLALTTSESTKTATIHSVCFSPDNKFIASGDDNGHLELWDIGAQCIHKVLKCHYREIVHFISFSSDGYFLIAGLKSKIQIWKIDDGTSEIVMIPSDHQVRITSIAISPNSSLVAAGGSEGHACIWNIKTAQQLAWFTLPNHTCIAFTPDGKGLVSGSADGTLEYCDISELDLTKVNSIDKKIWTISQNKQPLTSAGVSHDKRWVISGLANGRYVFCDLWNRSSHFELNLNLAESKTHVPLLCTSSASNIFATIEKGDKTVRLWRYNNI